MRPAVWAALVALTYVLHQDFWWWCRARPLVLGFLPIGLAYHALYCLWVSALMGLLVRFAWPAHLDSPAKEPGGEPQP
jgi:hypothetical protein